MQVKQALEEICRTMKVSQYDDVETIKVTVPNLLDLYNDVAYGILSTSPHSEIRDYFKGKFFALGRALGHDATVTQELTVNDTFSVSLHYRRKSVEERSLEW